jgi:hypothetical protein
VLAAGGPACHIATRVKVNPQTFFNFCAGHVPLLRTLALYNGELSEAAVFRLIRSHAPDRAELPETTWRRLRDDLQILVPTEPGARTFFVAEAVRRLLDYLFDEANPATPEMIRGYLASLETLARQLERAIEREDLAGVGLAFQEVNGTLRRIYADLGETQRSIQDEVAAFKTHRAGISVRDKYRRIVHWMERYVEPMIDVVRADGPLRAAFDELDRLLRVAREEALFNDHPALERNLRFLRLLRGHALRVFEQSRREIEPLYQSLRRSSLIAEGAAVALERLQKDGLARWPVEAVPGVFGLRWFHVPGDAAIALALRRVIEHPPEAAPLLALEAEAEPPPAHWRRLWVDALPGEIATDLPVADLVDWLIRRYPDRSAADLLAGMTALAFSGAHLASFTDQPARAYSAADGILHGHPIHLDAA